MKTLEQYLRDDAARGVIDHKVRCLIKDGRVTFYIHPDSVEGNTLDFEVHGNLVAKDRDVLYSGDPGHPDTPEVSAPAAPRPHLRDDGWPTRADMAHWTPAEYAIQHAVWVVEQAGASVALTDAVTHLAQAQARFADHAEGRP